MLLVFLNERIDESVDLEDVCYDSNLDENHKDLRSVFDSILLYKLARDQNYGESQGQTKV